MSNFKENFEQSLQRLAEINGIIDANIKSKQDFSKNVIDRLRDINQKIKDLAGSIGGLKEQISGLQTQVASNDAGIQDRTSEINRLNALVEQLTTERDALRNELDQLKNQYMADKEEFQKRIDDSEAQIRALTDQNTAIASERDALKSDLQTKGDLGEQHAKTIKNLVNQYTEKMKQHDAQLEEQKINNNNEIKRIQDEIVLKDNEINRINDEYTAKSTELQEQIAQLTKQHQDAQAVSATLETQIQSLQAENEDLTQRIISATQAIMSATDRLQELNNPEHFNQSELDATFEEITKSIQEISNAIQGKTMAPVQSQQKQANKLQSKLPGNTVIIYEGWQKPLSEILESLRMKAQKDPRPDNKYALALQQLYEVDNVDAAIMILSNNNISLNRNTGTVRGGNTTKKNRKYKKQKGGFTYKHNAKRQRITTSLFSKPSMQYSTSMSFKSSRGRGLTKSKKRTTKR
jgi:chromosome segregation ATPase